MNGVSTVSDVGRSEPEMLEMVGADETWDAYSFPPNHLRPWRLLSNRPLACVVPCIIDVIPSR